MADKPIRVGFVGAGANTRKHHIPKLKAQPGVELVAVANRSKESGERVAKEFGIARVHGDWREVVEAKDVDAICIGTWPYMHRELTRGRAGRRQARAVRGAHGHERRRGPADAGGLAARRRSSSPSSCRRRTRSRSIRALKKLLAEGYAGEVHAVEVQGTPAGALRRAGRRRCTGARTSR